MNSVDTGQAIFGTSSVLRRIAESTDRTDSVECVLYGDSPLVFSAVHATPQTRGGRQKSAESLTGALALHLALALEAAAILPAGPQVSDPNFDLDENSPYKVLLKRMSHDARMVVDIHGMRDDWGVDISIGTASSQNATIQLFSQKIVSFAAGTGARISIDRPFTSAHPGTIAASCRRWGVPAVQLELSKSFRTLESVEVTFDLIRKACNAVLQQQAAN